MRDKLRERDIEKYVIKKTHLFGGELRKVKWVSRRGAPDRRVMLPKGSFWVELKRPEEGLDEHQLREITLMRCYLETVYVINTFEEVDRVLALYA